MDDADREIARSDMAFWQEETLRRFDALTQFVLSAWKGLMLVNGGAVVALLTLAGNAADRVDGRALRHAFEGYGAGLVATLLSIVAAYASQSFYFQYSASQHTGAQHEAAGKPGLPRQQRFQTRGRISEWVGLGVAVCGVAGFAVGSWFALSAVLIPGQLDTAIAPGTHLECPNACRDACTNDARAHIQK